MKDFKRKNLKREIYQEELIRVDYYIGSNEKEKFDNFSDLLVKKGYKQSTQKVYSIKYTLLDCKVSACDDYFENSRNDKVRVFENDNHKVYLTKCSVIIHNKIDKHYLKSYNDVLKLVMSELLSYDDVRIINVRYEAQTQDFIKRIDEVDKLYNDLRIDTSMKEQYNRFKLRKNYFEKERNEEHYSCEYRSDYFNESDICYNKVVNFSTAEYYNNAIGRVIINICTNYFDSGNNKVSKTNVIEIVNELKEKQFEVLLSSFKEEYLDKLF